MILFLFVLEGIAVQDIVIAIAAAIAAIITWRTGLLQNISTNSKQLMETAKQERDAAKKEVQELKDENRILRREITQRIEINLQDQEAIRDLRGKEHHNG